MATTVTAAHHFIWRHLYAIMQAEQTLRLVAPDKECSMSTLWQEEEYKQICNRDLLTEKTAETEKTISAKEHERKCYDFNPMMFYVWHWRLDAIVINKNHSNLHILEFK